MQLTTIGSVSDIRSRGVSNLRMTMRPPEREEIAHQRVEVDRRLDRQRERAGRVLRRERMLARAEQFARPIRAQRIGQQLGVGRVVAAPAAAASGAGADRSSRCRRPSSRRRSAADHQLQLAIRDAQRRAGTARPTPASADPCRSARSLGVKPASDMFDVVSGGTVIA